MATYKMQVMVKADTALPKDIIVNTFHLDDHGLGSDPDQLCQDTLDAFQGIYNPSRPIEVRAYPTGAAPNFPVGQAEENQGTTVDPANCPREVAVCLSYYGERNLPRTRGRMYICIGATQLSLSGSRVSPFMQQSVLDLGGRIANIGGADVDWITWSTIDGAHEPVQHSWVDNEYDTIRKRGLTATERVTATHSETGP